MPPSTPMSQQQPPGAYPVGQPPGHFGGPGGAPPGPPKKKTGLVVGISIAVVAVIGGVVALIVLLSGDDEPPLAGRKPQAPPTGGQAASSAPGLPGQSGSSAPDLPPADPGSGAAADDVAAVQKLADDLLAAANSRDNAALRALICSGKAGDASFDEVPDGVVFEQSGEVVISGDTAVIRITASNAEQSDEGALAASKQGGQWCLSGPG
ncbi:hypothetical protein [Saccharomonospora xinjiangensis]|nr:hypothetical protein [Saccharomonospora xinjiangensis]